MLIKLFLEILLISVICSLAVALIDLNTKPKRRNSRNFFFYKFNPMTETEKKFIRTLKPFTDKENLIILTQVPLYAIFETRKNDIANFNRIRAKTIDFAIVDNNYNYKGFIELDDYTHNREDRIKRDIFVNEIFRANNLDLKRIPVKKEYDLQKIDEYIKEITNQATSSNSNGLK